MRRGNVLARLLRLLAALAVAAVVMYGTAVSILEGPTLWAGLTGRVEVATLQQGQVVRHYRVYRPAALERRPGLVIVLHGANGTGRSAEWESGFDEQADRLRWIVAYPDGVADGWDAFGCCQHPGVDDVAFIADVIGRLVAREGVNPNRVYVTGISRGGMMAYRLACELSSLLAAVAPVAGNMADARGSVQAVHCGPARPVSVLAIHGSDDPEVPINGGRSHVYRESITYAPLDDVIGKWRQLDSCAPSASVSVSGSSTTTTWRCATDAVVERLVLYGAGHTWPGRPIANAPWAPAASLDASRVIADFFAAHLRASAAA